MANKLEFSREELQAIRKRALDASTRFISHYHNPPEVDGSTDCRLWHQAYDQLVAATDRLDAMLARCDDGKKRLIWEENARATLAGAPSVVPDSPPSGELTDVLGSS